MAGDPELNQQDGSFHNPKIISTLINNTKYQRLFNVAYLGTCTWLLNRIFAVQVSDTTGVK